MPRDARWSRRVVRTAFALSGAAVAPAAEDGATTLVASLEVFAIVAAAVATACIAALIARGRTLAGARADLAAKDAALARASARAAADEELRASEARFRRVFDSAM